MISTTKRNFVAMSTFMLLSQGCHSDTAGQDQEDSSETGDKSESTSSETGMQNSSGESSGVEESSTGQDESDTSTGDADKDDINKFILSIPHFELPQQQEPMEKECEKNCIPDTDNCSYTYYGATDHFSEFVVFQPNSASLWPGVIVQGKDAQVGLLTPVSLPRAPMTFSLSLANLQGSPVGVMEEPKLSTYRQTLLDILAQGVKGETPAAINFEMTQVNSEASLSRLLKTDVSWGKDDGNKIAGMFDFKKDNNRYKLAVKFDQAYYTVDIDTPELPSTLFEPEVTLEEVQSFMDGGNPPMILQSITYGRRAVLSIETTHDLTRVQTAFSAAIKASIDVNVSVNTEDKKLLDSLEMKAFVLGGSGDAAIKTISGLEGLTSFLKEGATYSVDSPGAAIAYKSTYLDNTGTKFALTTEFAEASCAYDMEISMASESIFVDKNGEGKGKAELSYYAKASADGGAPCFFIDNSGGTFHHDDGSYIPLNVGCNFTLDPKFDHKLDVEFWTKEQGDGFFDKTKEAKNTAAFTYNAGLKAWQPLVTGDDQSLTASNGKSGETLSMTFNYSVSVL